MMGRGEVAAYHCEYGVCRLRDRANREYIIEIEDGDCCW